MTMGATVPFVRGERNLALDGLRGLAIALVLVAHYYAQVIVISDWHGHSTLKQLLGFTFSGVELFFVLSGYLIGSIVFSHRAAKNLLQVFYVRRLCRTVPAYAVLLLAFLAARASPTLNTPLTSLEFVGRVPWWSYLLMVQNIFFALTWNIGPWWLVITWSLAVEEQFYLFMPWLARLFQPRTMVWLAGASLLFCPLLRYACAATSKNLFAAFYLLPTRMDSLLVGVALAALCQEPGWLARAAKHRRLLAWAMIVFWVSFFIAPFGPAGHSPGILIYTTTLLGLGFALMILYVLVAPDSWLCRTLRHPVMVFLGGVSYFVYLFHLPVLYTMHALVHQTNPVHLEPRTWLATVASLAVVLLLGGASRRWLELPFIKLGHTVGYRDSV